MIDGNNRRNNRKMIVVRSSLLLPLLSVGVLFVHCMPENERLQLRQKAGYRWPLPELVPNTPGWNRIMNRRFDQISHKINDRSDKWNAWMAVITSALVATNYTENGWGLTRAPDHITQRLQTRLNETLDEENKINPESRRARKEHFINVIGGEDDARPLMIYNDKENRNILNELKPMFEWWSGIDLKPSIAYGIRAYRNDSNLLMHIDKPTTHVISGIYHVGRSEDAEPWPIVIEDFHGNTNQVYLTPGDILFYESSKCFHGRPQTFYGGYYASVFLHYAPASKDFDEKKLNEERTIAIPPHWHVDFPPREDLDDFTMVGTSFKEPGCKNLLCSLDESSEQSKYTVNWYGPGPRGMIATNGWDPETMEPPREWVKMGFDGGKGVQRGGADDSSATETDKELGCSPRNIDLCDNEQKIQIARYLDMTVEGLAVFIAAEEKKLEDARATFSAEIDQIKRKHASLAREKSKKIIELRNGGLDLMKAVKTSKSAATASAKLEPTCSPNNMDICDDEQTNRITKYQNMSDEDLDAAIAAVEMELKDIDAAFLEEINKNQEKYVSADEKFARAHNGELDLMKAILKSKTAAASSSSSAGNDEL